MIVTPVVPNTTPQAAQPVQAAQQQVGALAQTKVATSGSKADQKRDGKNLKGDDGEKRESRAGDKPKRGLGIVV